jgi:elongation factor G
LELPADILDAVLDELGAAMQGGGVIAGFALLGLRVTVLSAVVSEEGSDDVAFRIAANDAFEQGLRQAQPVLLEPIMKLNINTPEEYLGDFVGDIQQRRGTIIKTDHRGDRSDIEAQAPLKELFGYSSAMRSISQGRASCSLEPLNYAPAPAADMALYQF